MLNPIENSILQSIQPHCAIRVAFSGGIDSTALLLACLSLKQQKYIHYFDVIHINHQQPHSQMMAKHCQKLCDHYHLDLTIHNIDTKDTSNEGVFRTLRYQCFQKQTPLFTQILLGHHMDDQAETFLLKALRGGHNESMASMRNQTQLYHRIYIRPFLKIRKHDLTQYIQSKSAHWFEDPTNQSIDPCRNYLRHTILPALVKKWPDAIHSLSQSAAHAHHQFESQKKEAALFQMNQWLKKHSIYLTLKQLETVLHQFSSASPDTSPLFQYKDRQIVRFKNKMFIIQPQALLWEPIQLSPSQNEYRLFENIKIKLIPSNQGIPKEHLEYISLRPKRLLGNNQLSLGISHQKIKKYFQQLQIPTWVRSHYPLIFHDLTFIGLIDHNKQAKRHGDHCFTLTMEPSYHSWLYSIPQMDLSYLVDSITP